MNTQARPSYRLVGLGRVAVFAAVVVFAAFAGDCLAQSCESGPYPVCQGTCAPGSVCEAVQATASCECHTEDAAWTHGLLLVKAGGGDITLSWQPSCLETDNDYAVYEGTLGVFESHDAPYCDTNGATSQTLAPAAGSTYYLVVPLSATREGSYGLDSDDVERPQGSPA